MLASPHKTERNKCGGPTFFFIPLIYSGDLDII